MRETQMVGRPPLQYPFDILNHRVAEIAAHDIGISAHSAAHGLGALAHIDKVITARTIGNALAAIGQHHAIALDRKCACHRDEVCTQGRVFVCRDHHVHEEGL